MIHMQKTVKFTNFETDALKHLVGSTDCTPLDKVHEQMYAQRASKGDSFAREQLIIHNVRLTVPIAKHYLGQGYALDDLVSYGKEGLIKAVDHYDWQLWVWLCQLCTVMDYVFHYLDDVKGPCHPHALEKVCTALKGKESHGKV